MRKIIKRWLTKEYTPLEKTLMLVSAFLSGALIGFCVSPIKKGISIGSNNVIEKAD